MVNMAEKHNPDYRFQPNFSFAKESNTVRDLRKEPAKFLWFQLLTVMIENMTDDQIAINDMFTYACEQYKNNDIMCQEIKKFVSELSNPQTEFDAINWYTTPTFVSKMVNNALKSEDYVVLHKLRAFLKRLIEAIKEESRSTKEYWAETHTLYSGRSLTEDDIDRLKSQTGEIIAVNGFLSTSFSERVANAYHQNMYFRIRASPDLETVHFASILHRSAIRDDDEVLFSLSSTFRVSKITYDHLFDNTVGWIVDLTATDEGSEIFKTYLSWAQKDHGTSHALTFSDLLIQMGEYGPALAYLDEYCRNEDQVRLSINKGYAHFRREGPGDLESAKTYFLDALKVLDSKPERIIDRVLALRNLGTLYDRKQKYDEALEKLQEAKKLTQNDPEMLAIINNNIGVLYDQGLENYSEAEAYYKLALEYYRQHPTHHFYAETLQNLACVVDTLGQHERARCLYYEAKKIYDQTLPSTHTDIRRILVNIALTYYCEGQFQKSININREATDSTQSDSLVEASRLCNMGEAYREKGLYILAMDHSLRGLNMRRKILGQRANHVDIATALCNVGQIYLARGDFVNAASWLHGAENMLKNALNPNRIKNSPTLSVVYDCLAQLSLGRKKIDEALHFGELARKIFEHEKMTTVIEYVTCLLTISKAQHQRKEYDQARNIAKQARMIFEKYLPLHPARIEALYCLASVAEHQNNLFKARQYMEKAMKHLQDIESHEIRLFYKCTQKIAFLCYRQKDCASAYKYLLLWRRLMLTDDNKLH
jgi:tetratricopeptide (TPR) repeat protein